MNYTNWRNFLFIDTRFNFIGKLPKAGSLLDIGSSDGQTLTHFNEARPDLKLYSTDIAGKPELYPPQTNFFRGDITKDSLPWASETLDAITCMHLVEHINDCNNLFSEAYRLLKPGAKMYIETPHPKTLALSMPYASMASKFTFNFWDDLTHQQIMPIGKLAALSAPFNFEVTASGTSRNWLFAFLYPFSFLLSPRKKIITLVHFIGWSSFIILQKKKL
jgi:SAM-dependent methyltransferase